MSETDWNEIRLGTSLELAHKQIINLTKQIQNIGIRLDSVEETLISAGILDVDECITRLVSGTEVLHPNIDQR